MLFYHVHDKIDSEIKQRGENRLMNENQRINVDVDKSLWRDVGIRCAEQGVTKRTFMEQALEEKLERDKNKQGVPDE